MFSHSKFAAVFVLCVTALGLLVLPGVAQDMPIPADAQPAPAEAEPVLSDSVRFLWGGMHEAGMIDDDQFQHVLEHGRLPGGSTVQNSPLSEDRQKTWANLSEDELVTPEELAHMLFKGTIPNMAAWEVKAFEELAPVYESDRRKRLTYDLRRKHERVELIRLRHRARAQWDEDYKEAVERAEADELPLRTETDDGRIAELFAYDHDRPLYNITCNRVSADTISTDEVRPGGSTSFALTGTNMTVAIWDGGGVRTSHQEFAVARVSVGDGAGPAGHATSVAGTMVAAGVQSNAQGMAYAGNVLSFDWNYNISEMSATVASQENIRVSNHSYSIVCGWDNVNLFWLVPRWWGDTRLSEDEDYIFGHYTDLSRDMDEFCYSAPYHLPCFSVGNERGDFNNSIIYPMHGVRTWPGGNWNNSNTIRPDDGGTNGFDCISPRGVPKNILTVGAVEDLPGGYTNGATVTLDWYSGTGPADDGRVKPDVVANGQALYTPNAATNDAGYNSVSGTSFSSPSVAGSLLLLQELHERIYGTNAPLLASTVKALVIHTADDVGNVGPDYRFGWGLMNTPNAAWVITNNASWDSLPHIKEVSLADGDYIEFDALASTNDALKVTIAWTDPPGAEQPWSLDSTNLVLVNDLDLRVISPDGTLTNFPWVLDPQNPATVATNADNLCDNVEQVLINDPTNGWYTIRVSHKGTISNDVQDVSIIVTGNTPTNAPDFYFTDVGIVGTNDLVQVEWPGVVGALYEVSTSTNLLASNGWTNVNLTISANRELLEWIDENSEYYDIRFYRLHRLK